MKIRVTDRDGDRHEVDGQKGLKLMEVLRDLDYGVEAICGKPPYRPDWAGGSEDRNCLP